MAFSDLMDQKLPQGLPRGDLLGGVAEGALQLHLDPTEGAGRFG